MQYFYGMSVEEIRQLTVPQFEDRVQDIAHIMNEMNGEGGGRKSINHKLLQEQAMMRGIAGPRT